MVCRVHFLEDGRNLNGTSPSSGGAARLPMMSSTTTGEQPASLMQTATQASLASSSATTCGGMSPSQTDNTAESSHRELENRDQNHLPLTTASTLSSHTVVSQIPRSNLQVRPTCADSEGKNQGIGGHHDPSAGGAMTHDGSSSTSHGCT